MRILEDDVVEFWGRFNGITLYEANHSDVEVPHVVAYEIERIEWKAEKPARRTVQAGRGNSSPNLQWRVGERYLTPAQNLIDDYNGMIQLSELGVGGGAAHKRVAKLLGHVSLFLPQLFKRNNIVRYRMLR
jgi:hypothetical protein